jgi:single-strand DNA-binding protein
MSRSLNKVTLIGNVGAEPEVKQTASGTKLAKVSIATSRTFNDRSGQRQEKTEWHRVTFWDRMAEIVEQYVHKGDRMYVEGRLEYSQSEDGQGGTRYWTDIIAQEMILLGGGAGGGGGMGGGMERDAVPARAPRSRQPAAPSPFDDDDDDLPF